MYEYAVIQKILCSLPKIGKHCATARYPYPAGHHGSLWLEWTTLGLYRAVEFWRSSYSLMSTVRPDRTALRTMIRTGVGLIAGALAFACVGAAYQEVGTWIDTRRFPQRGRSFQAGSVRLNMDCSGQGGPTVILESGLGGPALDWILVQPEVAKFARVCSYDRAGYSWSESSPEPRTSLQIA